MSSVIIDLLGKSPVKPIQEHIGKTYQCSQLLEEFLIAANGNNWQQAAKLQAQIVEAENQADEIKHAIRANLPKSVWMPFARSDVIELLTVQDRMANKAKDIGGLMLGRKMVFPQSMAASAQQMLKLSIKAAEKAKDAISELDELLESGFSGKEIDLLQGLLNELDKIERDSDKAQVVIRADLLALENDLPAVEVMFLYRIIDLIGDIADVSQQIGNRLLLLSSK